MVTFCAEPFPNYSARFDNCIVAGPGSDDEGPAAIVAFLEIPFDELDRRRPGGREHRRQRRMSLSCLPFPPGALQLYGGKGSSFLCSSRRLDSRPVRSSRKLRHLGVPFFCFFVSQTKKQQRSLLSQPSKIENAGLQRLLSSAARDASQRSRTQSGDGESNHLRGDRRAAIADKEMLRTKLIENSFFIERQ